MQARKQVSEDLERLEQNRRDMEAFDRLPKKLRDYINYEHPARLSGIYTFPGHKTKDILAAIAESADEFRAKYPSAIEYANRPR